MNILIISDTHGRSDRIDEAIKANLKVLPKGETLTLLFLGDGLRDLYASSQADNVIVYEVKGNCDFGISSTPYGEDVPNYRTVELEGYRIFMTHGHMYDVKSTLVKAEQEAIRQGADILLFGHTHSRCILILNKDTFEGQKKELAVFNPGSLGDSRASFGTLTIKNSSVLFSHGTV